jgi:hypothetical protein
VDLRSRWRVAPRVHHVVTRIEQPFGTPASARPAVPAAAELAAIFAERLRGRIGAAQQAERDNVAVVQAAAAHGREARAGRKAVRALAEVRTARERARALREELARLEAAQGPAEPPAAEEEEEEAVGAADRRAAGGGVEEAETDAAEAGNGPWRRRAEQAAKAWEAEKLRRARTRSSRAPPQRRGAGDLPPDGSQDAGMPAVKNG